MAQKKNFAVGIDIGGTTTKFGIVNDHGEILEQGRIPSNEHEVVEDFIEDLFQKLMPMIDQSGGVKNFTGIGIGAPNGNIYTGTIEYAPNLKWKGIIPLAELIEKKFGLPTRLTNDANAAAMGEMMYGACKGMKHFITITLGTGVGSGIVIDGKIVVGHDGFAGELGHTIIRPGGRLHKSTGMHGSLESYASATGVRETAIEMLTKHPEEFGNGAIEAVAGPEAANNASVAGTLAPLLALGLPTSATAAILLAAFQQYGLQPGPLLFDSNPELVWGLIASLYIGNVLLLVLNLPLVGLWVQVLRIPRAALYASILLFATMGAYSLHQSVVDLLTLLVFGLMGFGMRRYGFPAAPAVIGLILGHGLVFIAAPIVEAKTGLLIDPFSFDPWELVLFPVLVALASLIGIVPGLTAYRTDVAQNLS